MIHSAEWIEQPCSGQYVEKIYDIKSPWNSSKWTWIKFSDEDGEWCGEFRGEYRGVSISNNLGVVIVLTSDYMFELDINTAELIEYDSQPEFIGITTSPKGNVFLTDGYGIEFLVNNQAGKIESITIPHIPVQPDNLRFVEWNDNILKIRCDEFLNWENEIELYLDCESMEWVDHLRSDKQSSSIKEKLTGLFSREK